VTQFEFEPIRDADHPNSACYLMMWPLTQPNMRAAVKLMQKYTVLCENGTIPSDYDFGLTITGPGQIDMIPDYIKKIMTLMENKNENMDQKRQELQALMAELMINMKRLESSESPGLIQMWMCYSNKGGADEEFDDQWFEAFAAYENLGTPFSRYPDFAKGIGSKKTPVSWGLANLFIFKIEREMEYPFVKRDRMVNQLSDDYADVYTEMMGGATGVNGVPKGMHLVSQIQVYAGGAIQSNEASSYSSFSWRDQALLWQCHDAFYDNDAHQNAKEHAEQWQKETDAAFIGPDGAFGEKDMRMFAYTWLEGDGDQWQTKLEDQWQYYYDSKEKYERLRRIKFKADPDSVFNSSAFCLTPIKD